MGYRSAGGVSFGNKYFASLVCSRNLSSLGSTNLLLRLELESAILQESVEGIGLRLREFESVAFGVLFLFIVLSGGSKGKICILNSFYAKTIKCSGEPILIIGFSF